MDGYLHKSKYSNFPKLQSSTSTWYKTFNLDKSKNNYIFILFKRINLEII